MAADPAPDQSPPQLSLERLFASPDLSGAEPRGLKLSPDGKYVTVLRNRAEDRDRYDLWAMDTSSGEWRMLVDSKKIGTGAELSEAAKMQRERERIGSLKGIVAYDWSPDARSILVPLDGDLYLASIGGDVQRLTATEAGELNPAISPKGQYVSFVRDQDLFVQPIGARSASAITDTGEGTVHWGEAEFVAQEEMDRHTGYWWSPDDERIAVERFDEAPVGVVTRAAIGASGTRVFEQRYPAAGTPNVAVSLYVMKPDGSGRVKVNLGDDPDIYLARVDWTPDGNTLLVQRENRAQTQLDMLAVNPISGASEVLFSEKAKEDSWINLSHAYHVLSDGSLIWWSERDGHGHLYRFRNGDWQQLTSGDWEVSGIAGVDEAAGKLYFVGNRDGVLERHLYVVDLSALTPSDPTRLTQAGWWNSAQMDDEATRAIISRSNPRQPQQVYLADASGQRIAWISENDVDDPDHPYHPYLPSHRETKFGTITTQDGTELHWKMITPPLEQGKQYPVFFQHYGGPHAQEVNRAWASPMEQYIVDRGYIFFELDNRGSANRGKAFEDAIYHAMGSVEVQDQLAGAKFLKAQPYVDPKRIGIYGWSYGGYMTLKMLEADPGVYAAGIAGAPVTKWELYDTHYTERYMGDPNKVPGAYARADALQDADKIADPLLLIHGMSDDNVVFENSTLLAAKMQAENVPFEMMFYPGKTHSAVGSAHVWTTIFDFFDREVKKAD
ncbi:DPP IV N-terminal domain-containing protein [Stakelama saccharophila]|uniref:DPP IV N-terminal domain-containing protein n=2 Tax=Stakelama saccharophila TaxID=3075605 RepID=A0ABZ0B662_9SPHN|nr:DPP IV N-terminal domain-containing protein [Stakelama sp. W311]WNO52743.1 DPP IV N-terminal domain-containing protein [Stakelama sp. W311]